MNRLTPFLLAIAAAIIIYLWYTGKESHEQYPGETQSPSVVRTTATGRFVMPTSRRFSDVPSLDIVRLSPAPIYSLQFRVHASGIFVYDHGDYSLKRFNHSGVYINDIGFGEGEGPGELSRVSDFAVTNNDVWICTPNSRTVHRFNHGGEYSDRFTVVPGPSRITVANDSLIVLAYGPQQPFQTIGFDGQVGSRFGLELGNQSNNLLALGGSLVPDSSGPVIFIPHYASYLFFFGTNRNDVDIIQTIDRLPFPGGGVSRSREAGNATIMKAPEQEIYVRNATLQGRNLYVHTWIGMYTDEWTSVIDKYNIETMEYSSSIELDFVSTNIEAFAGKLFALKGDELHSFAF